MKFIPDTNNQYKFNSKGDVFSLKRNRLLQSSNGSYSIIFNHGRRNIRKEALKNLYIFLEMNTKPIPNYSKYHITEYGSVYSLTTNCWINPFYDKDGYRRLALVGDDGIRKKERIPRLVALTYIDNPHGYPIVNHKDENKSNDFYGNLEWCTFSYNAKHSKSWLKRKRSSDGSFV